MANGLVVEERSALESFKWNRTALHALLVGSDGPVYHDLIRRAIKIEGAAKINASHAKPSVPGEGPAVQTGRLRSSITWTIGDDNLGLYADIGSNVEYAPYVELGTSNMAPRPYLRPALNAGRF